MTASMNSTSDSQRRNDITTPTLSLSGISNNLSKVPLTHFIDRPIPNSYWATPLLLACEYPWAPTPPLLRFIPKCSSKPQTVTQKLDLLLAAGVRTFIDLTEAGELSPYFPHQLNEHVSLANIDISNPAQRIEYHQFPIHDRSLPESVDYVYKILDVLRDNEKRGRITVVHCRGGIGRTGLVVGCWLVECGVAKDGDEALRMIAEEWKTVEKCRRFPCSPETGPQFEFVRSFAAHHEEREDSPLSHEVSAALTGQAH